MSGGYWAEWNPNKHRRGRGIDSDDAGNYPYWCSSCLTVFNLNSAVADFRTAA